MVDPVLTVACEQAHLFAGFYANLILAAEPGFSSRRGEWGEKKNPKWLAFAGEARSGDINIFISNNPLSPQKFPQNCFCMDAIF